MTWFSFIKPIVTCKTDLTASYFIPNLFFDLLPMCQFFTFSLESIPLPRNRKLLSHIITRTSTEVAFKTLNVCANTHCVKSVRIQSYSSLHFPAFGLNTERYFLWILFIDFEAQEYLLVLF